MYSIFHIEGGLGKHVAATAVAKTIKNNHPERKLIVVCAYPEIFLTLPFIDRVYRIGNTPYFYQDYIENKDSLIFKHEPYFTYEHINKRLPLIENWCKLHNLQYSGEMPELIFNIRNKEISARKFSQVNKPVLLLQTHGGPIKEQPYLYSWTRDMPLGTIMQIAERYSNEYHIVQICRDPKQGINGLDVVHGEMSNMDLFSMLLHSKKRIFIDSCMQHAAAALNLPSTVLWVATSPKLFGYDMHKNIVADLPKDFKLPDSYLFDYNFHGALHECPFTNEITFDLSNQLFSEEPRNQIG